MPRRKKQKPELFTPNQLQQIERKLATDPVVTTVNAIGRIDPAHKGDLSGLAAGVKHAQDLEQQLRQIQAGDLSGVEAMLGSQMLILQSFFTKMIGLAGDWQGSPEACERYARLSFRAQAQFLKTVETLSELRNPKRSTVFVKNYVNQQLNQQLNELRLEQQSSPTLEPSHYAQMDARSTGETAATDSTLEAVEIEYRSDYPRREISCQSEPDPNGRAYSRDEASAIAADAS